MLVFGMFVLIMVSEKRDVTVKPIQTNDAFTVYLDQKTGERFIHNGTNFYRLDGNKR